jgi:very-short-patch-repair endonuclease
MLLTELTRTQSKIMAWREALLDGSRTNQLLYFKGAGTQRGSAAVQLFDNTSSLVHQLLTEQKSQPEPITPAMLGLQALTPNASDEAKKEYQAKLDAMIKRLKKLRDKARDAQNNRGITVSFVVCGILHWRESEDSAEVIQSPLMLIPVEVQSKAAWSDEYQITRQPEGRVILNPTLREKLKGDFGIALPAITDDGKFDGDDKIPLSLSALLEWVRNALAKNIHAAQWSVSDEVYLGLFTFQRQSLYDDLVLNEALAAEHAIIRALCGEGALPPPRLPVISAGQLDEQLRPEETWQVLDADASQQEAIIAAKRGESFVLQGPPGTGKSQTIANIIAECLAEGKHILFVSEKMAAIEVVQKRLAEVGLGPFCLNLHHRGADVAEKTRVYDALRTALTAPANHSGFQGQRWEENVAQVSRTRARLNQYVRELHDIPRSALRKTVFAVYGILAEHAATPDIHSKVPDPTTMTASQLADIRDSLERISEYSDLLHYPAHPWRDTLLRHYDPRVQAMVRATYERLIDYLGMTLTKSATLANHLGLPNPIQHEADAQAAIALATFALTTPQPLPQWLQPDEPATLRHFAATAAQHHTALDSAHQALLEHYNASVVSSDFHQQQAVLTALAASPAQAARGGYDTFVTQEDQWRTHLVEIRRVLPELQQAGERIAQLCGLAAPRTLGECGALATLAKTIAQTPCPPPHWFEQSQRHAARKTAGTLAKAYRHGDDQRQQLGQTYDARLFALDLPSLRERFQHDYAAPLRYFRPTWYQDRKHLQATLQPGVALPTYATLARQVALAAETLTEEQQLAAKVDEHRDLLGPLFTEGATDWATLQEHLAWVETLSALAQEWDWKITPEIRALAAKPKRRWADFEAHQQQLDALWQTWDALADWLHQQCDIEPLAHTPALADAAPLTVLAQIEAMQAALSPFWDLAHTLAAQRRLHQPDSWHTLQQDVAAGITMTENQAWLAEQHAALKTAFADWYDDGNTDWAKLQHALSWCQSAIERHGGNQPPEAFLTLVTAHTERAQETLRDVDQLQQDLTAFGMAMTHLWTDADTILPRTHFLADDEMATTPFTTLLDRVQTQLAALPLLERWVFFLHERERCETLNLSPFLAALTQLLDTDRLPWQDHAERKTAWRVFEKCFYQAWLAEFTRDIPILKEFRGHEHERVIQQFKQADRDFVKHSQRRLVEQQLVQRHNLQQQMAQGATLPPRDRNEKTTMLLEVKRQAAMKRRKPLRKLIEIGGPVIAQLMPCWMMSPLSVSEYVDPRQMTFDIVIFDEASQICAEDAISSIIRGKQLIVVGDEKQMPPTNVFRKALVLDDEEDDSDEAQDTQRAESILKECAAVMPSRMLLFHYRSRHESLIAFSNAHFYQNQLVTFPGARAEHGDGLEFIHLSDAIYDRGGSRTNRQEAVCVADLLMNYAEQQTEQSVGVVAFSAAQQSAIDDEIHHRLQERPDLQEWFSEAKNDAFFIRNLESVQGDERDIIILSVGYGRDKTGKLTQNFGPLNSGGGERRLNVAITRARQKMIVVSSIRAGDITGASEGAKALQGYLDFAEHGPVALATAVAAGQAEQFDSPFEQAVCRALQAQGLLVNTQVGCSSYRIDLAIRDPERPGRYLLGIECDGARYHSAKTARDRDRLRQAQLENLGWQIHRIWSRDWFNNPQQEILNVLQRLEQEQAQQR